MIARSIKPRRGLVLATTLFALCSSLGAALSGRSQTPQDPTPPPLTPSQLFTERGCAHCHQWNGSGGHKGPDLSGVGSHLSAEAIRKQINEGGGAMPAFQDALPAPEIDALVELLRRSRKSTKPVHPGS